MYYIFILCNTRLQVKTVLQCLHCCTTTPRRAPCYFTPLSSPSLPFSIIRLSVTTFDLALKHQISYPATHDQVQYCNQATACLLAEYIAATVIPALNNIFCNN